MYFQALIWLFVLAGTANAAPVVGLFTAFASTTLGSIIINAAVGIALSIGSSLLSNLFAKKTQSRDPGTTVQLRVGGANPLAFPLGRCATAGIRTYYGVWSAGGTPNEYMVDVIAVSALPVPGGMTGLWMNDRKVTVRTDLPKTEMGWPIQEYFKNGAYYAWIDFHDGTQTDANPYLRSKFGSHPNYPWTSDMVGRGVAYVTLTARYDKDGLWQSGYPTLLIETASVPLYDIRKDSSMGGVGLHRWDNPATWEPSNNAMVRAYNVARGAFYYNGEWVYGGQNWPALRLPASSWMAAMNACDTVVGGEPQFHGGGTLECDMEVATVLEELLRSSSALIAEIGGAYKVRVGAPGAPVMGFTDANIIVTREQGYTPFPGLESTYNIARITYTEPVEQWGTKESPERRDAAAILSDDNRELPFSVDLPWVLSNLTAQRIGKTALENGRRFRRHSMYHAPLFWLIEPLDVVAWTSAHNQYVAKEFEVEQISGNSGMFQSLIIRENDPSDYVWNPLVDPLPYQIIPVVPDIVPAQVITGWQVFPAIIKDEQGRDRRPAIEIRFDGALTDIDRVDVEIRTDGETDVIWSGAIPYPTVPTSVARAVLGAELPPNSQFEVRGKFIPWTDRDTVWSAWLPVTTPDVKLIAGLDFDPFAGLVGFEQLEDDLNDYQNWVGGGIRDVTERLDELETIVADQDLGNSTIAQKLREQTTAATETTRAEYTREINVVATQTSALASVVEQLDAEVFDPDTGLPAVAGAVSALEAYAGPDGTLANAITSLNASSDPNNVAEANFRMSVGSGPAGIGARLGAEGRVGGSGTWRTAGWYIDVPTDPLLPTRFTVQADQFVVLAGSGSAQQTFAIDGTAVRLNVANIGTVNAGIIQAPDGSFIINLTNGSLEWFDP